MNLRPYQTQAIDEIRAHYSKGNKKVLLWLATGAGKTVVFSYILKQMSERGKKAAMIVRGRQLVDQASRRLFREGVRHGVRMAGHWNKDFSAAIQVCSVDTLQSRENFLPEADLIVIDEAHMAGAKGYRDLIEKYQDKFFLGVTATPFNKEGLGHLADVVVHPITMKDLITEGYLVPAKYFAPSEPDLKGVKSSAGDFVNAQIHEKMNVLTADIVSTWKRFGGDRPTLLFACNIAHSLQMRDAFRAANIPAVHLEADNTFEERQHAIDITVKGENKIICNVGIFCTGVDIPEISCIIMGRPTKSYNLFIQQAGRGTRPAANKDNFILLDHAGNVLRHGFIDEEPSVSLDSNEMIQAPSVKICKECFLAYVGLWCPVCGPKKQDVIRSKEIVTVEGELHELVGLSETIKISRRIAELKKIQKQKGYKRGWLFHRVKEEFGHEIAEKIFPKRWVPPWVITGT